MGLLAVETPSTVPAAERQLRDRFQAVVAFAQQHGRAPEAHADDFEEAVLGTRLNALRNDPEHVAILRGSDSLGLLNHHGSVSQANEPPNDPAPGTKAGTTSASAPSSEGEQESQAQDTATSLDDVLTSDVLGLLDGGDSSLFDLRHVPRYEIRQTAEEIAQRRHCDDFYRFTSFFERLRDELRAGEAETVRFRRATQIREGDAFVLNGMLCLVDSVGDQSEEAGRFNPRLRVVFDNETESNLLMLSLAAALYKDDNGRRVLQNNFVEDFNNISHRDQRVGTVYILRSLSERGEIQSVRNLYKIGYTEHSVETRIAQAARDKTFLEAPVKIVTTFDCYNLDPHRFERLIHAMLAHQRLNVTLRSAAGEKYQPREWFTVELDTAREVVRRIIDGSIVSYRINQTTGRIVSKSCEAHE